VLPPVDPEVVWRSHPPQRRGQTTGSTGDATGMTMISLGATPLVRMMIPELHLWCQVD
jgi:hypothetical protein